MSSLRFDSVEIYHDQVLGVGSYGKVCKAKYGQLPCAAKLLHDTMFEGGDPGIFKFAEQFERECHFLSIIKHPNVVQCLGSVRDPLSERLALVMELMEESLTRFLEQSTGPLPYHVQVNFCYDVALALSYLHSKDIIHRDLSSNNVLLIAGSRAKVTDFGMSKLMDVNSRLTPMTLCPGATVYMPPEALTTPPHYSNKLDCFSHAVLTIQIYTRAFPKPGIAHQATEDPNYPTGHVLIQVPETERRKEDIDKVEHDHPLLPIALRCLHNHATERLSADEICEQLATQKKEERYSDSVQQARDQTLLIQRLQREIAQKDRIIQQERAQHEAELVQQVEAISSLQIEKEEGWHRQKMNYENELQQKDILINKERDDHEMKVLEKEKIIEKLLMERSSNQQINVPVANNGSTQESTLSTPESPDFAYPSVGEDFLGNAEYDYHHTPAAPDTTMSPKDAGISLVESFGMEKSMAELDKLIAAELDTNTDAVSGMIYDDLLIEHHESQQEKKKDSKVLLDISPESKVLEAKELETAAKLRDDGDATSAQIFDEPIYDIPKTFKFPLYVTEKNIVETKVLSVGHFGNIVQATTVGLSKKDLKFSDTDTDKESSTFVTIKRLKEDADSGLVESFYAEAKLMAELDHDNVMRLLAICKKDTGLFMMTEYMENGSLDLFLQRLVLKPDTVDFLQDEEVTPNVLLYMGVQIANGMHYLSSQRVIHRELSTHSCLVGSSFVVKISNFEMCENLHDNPYYRVEGTLILPIRWMPCEAFYGQFSVKSDVWALGVTLWEIYTLGKVDPYNELSDEKVVQDAIKGPDRKILEKPPDCPQKVYDVMLRCWIHEPAIRANFTEVYSRLFLIYTS